MQKITPFLMFESGADEAIAFYSSIFKNSKSISTESGKPPGGSFEIGGLRFNTFNGGPHFKFSPAISFFHICENESELDELWGELAKEGSVMMPLDKYEWSDKYGFIQDKFGVCWQVSLGKVSDVGQQTTPSFLFVGDQLGNGEEAVKFYTSVFENSSIDGVLLYGDNEPPNKPGTVKHSQFALDGEKFMLMEGSGEHDFSFTEGISLMIWCKDQDEIDYFWNKFAGEGEESQCGWVKDKYGVSWQITPPILLELISDPDREKAGRVMQAMLKMKKIIIQDLKDAAEAN